MSSPPGVSPQANLSTPISSLRLEAQAHRRYIAGDIPQTLNFLRTALSLFPIPNEDFRRIRWMILHLEGLHRQETREIPDAMWGKASWEGCEVSEAVPEVRKVVPEVSEVVLEVSEVVSELGEIRQVEAEMQSPKHMVLQMTRVDFEVVNKQLNSQKVLSRGPQSCSSFKPRPPPIRKALLQGRKMNIMLPAQRAIQPSSVSIVRRSAGSRVTLIYLLILMYEMSANSWSPSNSLQMDLRTLAMMSLQTILNRGIHVLTMQAMLLAETYIRPRFSLLLFLALISIQIRFQSFGRFSSIDSGQVPVSFDNSPLFRARMWTNIPENCTLMDDLTPPPQFPPYSLPSPIKLTNFLRMKNKWISNWEELLNNADFHEFMVLSMHKKDLNRERLLFWSPPLIRTSFSQLSCQAAAAFDFENLTLPVPIIMDRRTVFERSTKLIYTRLPFEMTTIEESWKYYRDDGVRVVYGELGKRLPADEYPYPPGISLDCDKVSACKKCVSAVERSQAVDQAEQAASLVYASYLLMVDLEEEYFKEALISNSLKESARLSGELADSDYSDLAIALEIASLDVEDRQNDERGIGVKGATGEDPVIALIGDSEGEKQGENGKGKRVEEEEISDSDEEIFEDEDEKQRKIPEKDGTKPVQTQEKQGKNVENVDKKEQEPEPMIHPCHLQ